MIQRVETKCYSNFQFANKKEEKQLDGKSIFLLKFPVVWIRGVIAILLTTFWKQI